VPDSDLLYHQIFSHPRLVEDLVRTQVYQGLLWQQVIVEKKLKPGARLPPLLLVVLYNGKCPWKAVTDIRELVALSPDSPLWPWQPQVRYHVLDMSAFPGDDLMRRTSVAALLFRLERRPSKDELEELVGEVAGWFGQHPDSAELRRLFGELVRQAYVGLGITEAIPEDFLEMKTNLRTLGETWKQQWLAEGRAEGKAEALVCLLAERFGAIKPSLRKRIRAADLTTVECWFKRAIVAPDLLSVFAQPR
jgi:hypothetical protein